MRKNELVRCKKDSFFERQVSKGEYDDFFEEADPDKSEFDDDLVDELDDDEDGGPYEMFDDDDLVDELGDEEEISDPLFQAYERAEMGIDEDGEFQYNDGFHEEEY